MILLGLTRHTGNLGVRVLLSSAVEALTVYSPEEEILLLDYGYVPEQWIEATNEGERIVKLINLRFSWKLYLPNNIFLLVTIAALLKLLPGKAWKQKIMERNPWMRDVLHGGANYSIAGGDSFSDIYGLERILYVALPQVLVLLLDRPLVLLPQTYGPFRGQVSKFLARYILRRAKDVYSRDDAGVSTVRTLLGNDDVKVKVVPDLGFCMTAAPLAPLIIRQIENFRHSGPIVGLNVSKLLYIGGYSGENMFHLRESYPAIIDALVNHIVGALGAQVLFVPHVIGGSRSEEDETLLCEKLLSDFKGIHGDRVFYIDQDFDHREIKSVIGQCDIFIGARMHACIGAVSQAVPSVCLAYSNKFAGVMRPLGAGASVVDLRSSTTSEILNIVSEVFNNREQLRMELKSAIPSVKKAVNFTNINKL